MPTPAPAPGAGKRAAETDALTDKLVLTYDGEELKIAFRNLPMGERLICRKATGLAFESFCSEPIGEDSLLVLWWMARRMNGDWKLTFIKAEEEWDRDKFTGIDLETPDDEDLERLPGDDPEESGPR